MVWSEQKDSNTFKLGLKLTDICMNSNPTWSISWDLWPSFCQVMCPWQDKLSFSTCSSPFEPNLGPLGEKAAVILKVPSWSEIYSKNLLILQALVKGTDTSFFFLGNLKHFLWIYISLSLKTVVSTVNFKSPFWNSPCITVSLRAVRRGSCLCYFNGGEKHNKKK